MDVHVWTISCAVKLQTHEMAIVIALAGHTNTKQVQVRSKYDRDGHTIPPSLRSSPQSPHYGCITPTSS